MVFFFIISFFIKKFPSGSVVINNEEENKISEQKDLKSSFELLTAHHNNPNRLRFPRPDLTQVIFF